MNNNHEDFLKNLNNIDEQYFEEAFSIEKVEHLKRANQRTKIIRFSSSVAAVFIVIIMSAVLLLNQSSSPIVPPPDDSINVIDEVEKLEITALSEGDGGVSLQSGFRIKYMAEDVEYTENDIKNSISIIPEIDFSITKESVNSFILQPEQNLNKNTVYSFSVNGENTFSWAFQTESGYTVTKTIPANEEKNVPATAGIEITFSHLCSDITDFFEISPHVEGRFETHQKTMVFVPSEPLEYDKRYTITIKKGLTSSTGQILKEDYQFWFIVKSEKEESRKSFYLLNELTETYLPSDPVIIAAYAPNDLTYEMNVYCLADENEYITLADQYKITSTSYYSSYWKGNNVIDIDGRASIINAKVQPMAAKNQYNIFVLPENLQTGYYLVDIRHQDVGVIQKLVQISDLAVHAQSVNGQSLFWINDSATGNACAAANIELSWDDIKASGSTDQDGLAVIDYDPPAGRNSVIRITSADGKKYVELLPLSAADEESPIKDYYFYVYTDREVYLPTDTVNYWGMLLPRRTDTALPGSITLKMSGEADCKVTVNSDGSFSGKFNVKDRQSAFLGLEFYVGDGFVGSKSFSIAEYQKPAYKLDVQADKDYYRRGEQVTVQITGTNYEGTPASGVTISSKYGDIVLDKDGKGSMSYIAGDDLNQPYSTSTWKSFTDWREFSISGLDENQESVYSDRKHVFPSDVMLETDWIETGEYPQLKISTHKINFDNVDNGKYFEVLKIEDYEKQNAFIVDTLRGEKTELSGDIHVRKRTETKTKTGEIYDYILKETVEQYTYKYESSTVEVISFTTVDGEFVTEQLNYQNTEYESYSFDIYYTATDGFTLRKYASLPEVRSNNGVYEDAYKYKLIRNSDSYDFSEINPVTLSLKDKIANAPPTGGRLLYTVMQDRFLEKNVVTDGEINLPFDERLLPDFTICGAYFDGKHIYLVNSPWFFYDSSQRELDVTVTSDKQIYLPGEEVTLSIKVQDKEGKGVSSNIVASVVDEAAFAIREQWIDSAKTLYRTIFNVNFFPHYFDGETLYDNLLFSNGAMIFGSYVDYNPGSGGGGGGSDAGPIRSDFVDTAGFIPVTTDAEGNASVTFKLPDNITSWRATAVAIGSKPSAGHTKINFTTTLPFFIKEIYNKTLTTDEDFSISMRGMGTGIQSSDDITYNVTINDQVKDISSKAGDFSFAEFGKLPAGNHTVKIEAQCKEYTDIVELPIKVVSSRLEIPMTKVFDLSEGVDINAVKYPVTLMLYDKQYDLYMKALSYLSGQYGVRGDQQLASIFARAKLCELKGEIFRESISNINGVSNVSWAKPDILLTAKAMISMKGYMETEASETLLLNVIADYQSSADDVCSAYLGLAALRAPILLDVRELIKNDQLEPEQQLKLATALALLGDQTAAQEWYDGHIVPLMEQKDNGTMIRDYEFTSNALTISAYLNTSSYEDLLRYVLENQSNDYLPVLDIMGAVTYTPFPNKSTASFSYNLNGETIIVDFSEKYVHEFVFDETMMESANFKTISGEIFVNSYFTGGANILQSSQRDDIKINRELSSQNIKTGERIKITQTVDVEFTDENEFFTLSDVVPSGTRFDGSGDRVNQPWYIHEKNGKLQIILYNDNKDRGPDQDFTNVRKKITVTYYVRAILPGNSTICEPVLMSNITPGYASCDRLELTIIP